MSKQMTASQRIYVGRVKELPCSCCGKPGPSSAHHIREGQGMGQRAQHWLVVALCYDCHQGVNGVHGDRALMRIYNVDELDLLAETIKRLNDISIR